ncbi:hypothetical protein LT85_1331 [Collimonas arenae]|uniref:Uncharacterized protein n=1 Tax=Collimonas arenae TaxID=279058 RepID=A0A0A1F9Y9_9BURK|nr:hypothetical protein LT85_1331 [Collimonas arenae]
MAAQGGRRIGIISCPNCRSCWQPERWYLALTPQVPGWKGRGLALVPAPSPVVLPALPLVHSDHRLSCSPRLRSL